MIYIKHRNIYISLLHKRFFMMQQIVLKGIEKPREADVIRDIDWLCDSFGFSAGRDIESTATKIVETLLEKLAEDTSVSSEAIADELNMAPSRVNHHVRNIVSSGMLYRERKLILLRGGSLKSAVEEMRRDANRLFDDISKIAEDIDSVLGFRNMI